MQNINESPDFNERKILLLALLLKFYEDKC